jgi:hypothetical protein
MEPNPYEAPKEQGQKTAINQAEPVFFAATYMVVILAWVVVTAILALVVLGMAAEVWPDRIGH